jgi:hypothetical protein
MEIFPPNNLFIYSKKASARQCGHLLGLHMAFRIKVLILEHFWGTMSPNGYKSPNGSKIPGFLSEFFGIDSCTVDCLTMHDITMHTCQKISQCIGIWLEQMARSHPKPCLIMHISDNAWPSKDFGRAPDHMHFEIVNCISLV